MRAIILAAGIGKRLGDTGSGRAGAKSLLRFGGRSLLERQLGAIGSVGVASVTIVTGYDAPAVEREARAASGSPPVEFLFNSRYTLGSLLSLWEARRTLRGGEPALILDADVLCDTRMYERLVSASAPDALLVDRGFEPGDEPVKVRARAGRVVAFGKRLPEGEAPGDEVGESVGFFKVSGASCAALEGVCERMIDSGGGDRPHEDALAEVMATGAEFAAIDATGLPWTEIDFPEDVRRANESVLGRLVEDAAGAPLAQGSEVR